MRLKVFLLMMFLSTAGFADVKTDLFGAFPASVTCAPDLNLMFMTLSGEGLGEFKPEELALIPPYHLELKDDSPTTAIRVELCTNDDLSSVVFKRLIRRLPSIGAWTGFRYDEVTSNLNVPNPALAAALFQNVKDLHLEFRNQSDPSLSYLLKGHLTTSGRPLITVSHYDAKGSSPLKPSREFVYAGLLIEGDPFIPKGKPAKRLIVGSGVKLEFDLLYTGSKGNYFGYKFKSFQIEDQVTGLHYQGGPEDPRLKINYTHHGLNDSFEFRFDEDSYILQPGELTIRRSKQSQPIRVELDCEEVVSCGQSLL